MMSYKFPAVKGKQANSEYYICMVPLGILSKLFISEDVDVAAEYRVQRKLNGARIPQIKDYIINNRDEYVFSALAASVDGSVNFISSDIDSNVGMLEVSMAASLLINDGQHRKAAIQAAIEEDETLKEETISIVLFKDKGLIRSQQMFTDLNKHAVNTSKSLNAMFDSKSPMAIITKILLKKNNFFRKYTDTYNDTLGKYSSNLFTFNNLVNASSEIFKNDIQGIKEAEEFLCEFWDYVVSNIKEWKEMDNGQLNKKDLRENYIITQGVAIRALGLLGNCFYKDKTLDMKKYIANLSKVDWLRNNPDWLNRIIKPNGRINMNTQGIYSTYLQIKRQIGLPLTREEINKENI